MHFFIEGFGYTYTFSVRGESANYLMNKYDLKYSYVKVIAQYGHRAASIRVISETEDISQYDAYDIYGEDLTELLSLLKEDIDNDLRNYEEWQCNSDYYKRDSRWE